MHRQMADMMKTMGRQRGGLMQRMFGVGPAGPNPAERDKLQADLARLDPKALERLPKELRQQLPKGLGGGPNLPGLPGLGAPGLPGLPGLPRKKK
jgi:signal recognition particle subunit SRP54